MRIAFLIYGAWQDANSPLKYTDIDYYVFTDAARSVARGGSPYERDTYRYTPLLAWMLMPTAWWFPFGKVLFSVADVLAGAILYTILAKPRLDPTKTMETPRALRYTSIWLLNPLVVNISTRGSAEGLLGLLAVLLIWSVRNRRVKLAGFLLGLATHFKIYPFIYGVTVVIWLDRAMPVLLETPEHMVKTMFTRARCMFGLIAFSTFFFLNVGMTVLYRVPFLMNTFVHHLIRIDHRHNFSPYSTLLYLSAADHAAASRIRFESLAFLPQLILSVVIVPLYLARRNLAGTMMVQTFVFVTFNKVCTSQYFLWYLIFLPLYLPTSSLVKRPKLCATIASVWVLAQVSSSLLQSASGSSSLSNLSLLTGPLAPTGIQSRIPRSINLLSRPILFVFILLRREHLDPRNCPSRSRGSECFFPFNGGVG